MRRTQQVLVVYTLLLGTFGIIDALAQQPQKERPPDVAQHSAAQNGTQKIVAQGVQAIEAPLGARHPEGTKQ